MKLLLIRHGEPNYELDCLTGKGREQAAQLGARLREEKLEAAFVSPMGRARETAQIALAGREVPCTVCDWLHEFDVKVRDEDIAEPVPVWDIYPKNWTADELHYDRRLFYTASGMRDTGIYERFEAVKQGLDSLLASYGLVRENGVYRKQGECSETLALFCHFGATCAVAAHLLGVSPVVTLQGFSAEPTAIATFCTDDRFGELVNFRLHGFGDISHLSERGSGIVAYK